MSTVRFIRCLHLGHENMAKHRGFTNSSEHNKQLISKWNEVVSKRDLTYILGDVTMENPHYFNQLDKLNGRKIVVLGNHDLPKHIRILLRYVESVAGMIDYKGFCLTHAPIHPDEVGRYRGNIHAHIHENILTEHQSPTSYRDDDSVLGDTLHKYYNVDAAAVDYTPVTIEQILIEQYVRR